MSQRTQTAVPAILLRLRAVENRTGLRKSMIYQLMSEGRFPQSVKISERCVAWRQSQVNAWISERIAASERRDADNA